MKQSAKRVLEIAALTSTALNAGGSAWGGPPGVPNVPVGGVGSAVVTALVIVGYGIWKSRR